jgi:MraZ protein
VDLERRIEPPVFFGTYNHTIDAKGRTSLPVKLREALAAAGEPRIVLLRNSHSRSLLALPQSQWSELARRVSSASPFDAAMQRNVLKFVATAQEVDLDVHGRVLVPPALREWAGLQKEIVWVGMGGYIQLYDQAAFEAEMAAEIPADQRVDFFKV